MREALWNVHHPTIISGQLGAVALAKGGGTVSQIKDHVIQRATDAPYNLRFGFRCELVMHATKGALLSAQRVIYLTNTRDQTMLAEFLFAESAREKASLVGLSCQGQSEMRPAMEWD